MEQELLRELRSVTMSPERVRSTVKLTLDAESRQLPLYDDGTLTQK